jgi:cellulose biosynthesis protein BcsQ
MSSIVTFYSYKGGVGRTMAMANVAVLLAQRNLKVLAVDWDLEAPGLERYFGYFTVTPSRGGLLRLLRDQQRGSRGHYRRHLHACPEPSAVIRSSSTSFRAAGRPIPRIPRCSSSSIGRNTSQMAEAISSKT